MNVATSEDNKESIGIISNMFTEHMFEKQYDLIHLPTENIINTVKDNMIQKVIIEINIYEEDHQWYNKSFTDVLSLLEHLNVEITLIDRTENTSYPGYKKIFIDHYIDLKKANKNNHYMPIIVDEEKYNPANTKHIYDIVYLGNNEGIFDSFNKRKKYSIKNISLTNITRDSLKEIIELIKQTKIVYIDKSKSYPSEIYYYLEVISTLMNSLVFVEKDLIESPKYAQSILNHDSTMYIIQAMLDNQLYFDKNIIQKTRTALINNTYIVRDKITLEKISIDSYKKTKVNISVIISTKRKNIIQEFINQINQQNYVNIQIVLLTHGFELSRREKMLLMKSSLYEVDIIECDNNTSFGNCLNKGVEKVKHEYVIKMDDDDYYYPNFIIDIYLGLKYSKSTLSGKHGFFFYLEGENVVGQRRINKQYVNTSEIKGNTMLCRTKTIKEFMFSDLSRHVDTDFIQRIRDKKGKVFCIHPYDMCVYRADNKQEHTYQVDDSRFLRDADILYYGAPNSTISSDLF